MRQENEFGDAVEWIWRFRRVCPTTFQPDDEDLAKMKRAFSERLDPYEAAAAITEDHYLRRRCGEISDGGKWKKE